LLNAYAFCNLPFSEGYEKLAQANYDMFADDDEHDTSKPSTDENNAVSQSSSDAINSGPEGKYIASLKLASEMDFFVTDKNFT